MALPRPSRQLERSQPVPPSPSPPHTTTMASVCKSLKLPLPAHRHTHNHICSIFTDAHFDLADIFTDIAPLPALAWQSSSMPYTPIRAYSEYNPIELIVDCATLPSPQASPSSSSIEENFRSRWSRTTVATLATRATAYAADVVFTFGMAALHLGSVVRRVRARRMGVSGSDNAFPKTHARSTNESSVKSGANGEGSGAGVRVCARESCLWAQTDRSSLS
ncbi:hypothetical protein EDB83DRAFT_2679522 [Lactarius deliciosus]|nr:hypothetical protein EDB83DRAFT_2679522 [Lactarius deliciosus]